VWSVGTAVHRSDNDVVTNEVCDDMENTSLKLSFAISTNEIIATLRLCGDILIAILSFRFAS